MTPDSNIQNFTELIQPKLRNIHLLGVAQPFSVCDLLNSNVLALECLPLKTVIDFPAAAPRRIKIKETPEKEEIKKKPALAASGAFFT